MKVYKCQDDLIMNLQDAGCSPEMIKTFLEYCQRDKTEDLLLLLSRQRREILDNIHCNQKRIDCLDYLVYKIKKSTE